MLFTDIEGSTRMAARLRDRFGAMLGDHRRLLREAVVAHSGEEIDVQGDETFAAFGRATDAVAAAVAAQRAIAAFPWPDRLTLRVRMGIHTGEPTLIGYDYLGVDVHRAARIAAAARGGQVLLSSATEALVRDQMPAGVQLRDVGLYSLKDFDHPAHLFDLVLDDAERDRTGTHRRLRVVLGEDAALLREGVARVLQMAGVEVVGQAGNADELVREVARTSPDVAVVDIRMPPSYSDEGVRAAHEIRRRHPAVGVLVLSQYVEPAYAMELLRERSAGIGYLLKERVADVEEFVEAIRRVARGGSVLDPAVVAELVSTDQRRARA
jgi:class 3 adenylate cyclase/DNA-binding NarL/FixJ family response regulator